MNNPRTKEKDRSRRKSIGAFFTPLRMAEELIRAYDIHKKWASGASVLDPTAGSGNLLEALISCCISDGIPVDKDMLSRLKGYEREKEFTYDFRSRIRRQYGVSPPESCLTTADFMKTGSKQFDMILGNPPWLNFTDIPDEEKQEFKKYFKHYGLVEKGKSILLGHSRIDLAALIIQKAMQEHLISGGTGYFFIPLSLLLNEGAHNEFRKGKLTGGRFCISEIRDFGSNQIFQDVNTRCGFTVLQKSEKQKREIPYLTLTDNREWITESACPVGRAGSAYRITHGEAPLPLIRLSNQSRPRQGINTGGRNQIFIFNHMERAGDSVLRLSNKTRTVLLPEDLVYPLISSAQFKGSSKAERFIFLPYTDGGKVMSEEELSSYPLAAGYLKEQFESLTSRKGSMLGSAMKNGRYWALLGVGPYTFSKWKVVWEAYGKKEFNPRMFHTESGKPWIPNQALQASCSFDTEKDARRVLGELKNPEINKILKLQNMEGTCNWAQPGRISHFMEYL